MDSAARTVSIVVPTYRKKELLASTLNALCSQTYPHDLIEVVVVDDCSEDGTGEFLADLDTPFRLEPVRHEVNKGRAAARNTGILAAGGEIVVFLDDDMRADPRLVASHMRFHDIRPNAAAIGNALTAPELGDSLLFRYMDTRGVHKLASGDRSPARYFVTNNASVPRSALLEAGLFDEAFRSYGFEDTELAFRLEDQLGLSFWYLGDAIAHHIHHHTIDQFLEKRLIAARTSLPQLLKMHPGRARDLAIAELLPPSPDDGGWVRLRKLLLSLATAGALERAGRRLVSLRWLGPASYPLFDYLIAATYRRGLREAAALPTGDP